MSQPELLPPMIHTSCQAVILRLHIYPQNKYANASSTLFKSQRLDVWQQLHILNTWLHFFCETEFENICCYKKRIKYIASVRLFFLLLFFFPDLEYIVCFMSGFNVSVQAAEMKRLRSSCDSNARSHNGNKARG